jgi:outer membrane receptor protein involved in Fe transport
MSIGNTRKAGLVMVFVLALFGYTNAQEVTVKGQLVDSASAKPVFSAAINFNETEKKISRTVVSDHNGLFQVKLVPGNYRVTITHTAFRKRMRPLKVAGADADMGSIPLVALVKNLDNVSVTATRPMVEQQPDRLIYNVEDDPASKFETASDILRKTPYISVDGDGAIQVNGQTNFKVLLNGRETAMFSQNVKDALKGFPGSTISRIEVITSPSAKYDAEGIGGIINIITKKKLAGYNGSVNTSAQTLGNVMGGFNVNLKTGRVGISAMYNRISNNRIRSEQAGITNALFPSAFKTREVGGQRETALFNHQGNLELSFDLDSTNALVVYGNMGKHRNEAMNNYNIYTLFGNGTSDNDPYFLETVMEMPSYGFGTDYIRKYKSSPQKELSFRFNAMFNNSNNFSNSLQEMNTSDRYILNNSEAVNSEYTVQGDMVEPMNKTTRLETGVKTILRKAHSDFESLLRSDKAQPYVVNAANSNRFGYDQDVYSVYLSVNKNFKTFSARVGARLEHTRVDGDFISTSTTVKQRYTNVIPNVLLTKQISKTMNANFTYTMRLGRPSIQNLNPFVNNADSLNISYGNPNLGPQYIHSFNGQYRIFKGSKFISFNTGFNFSNNLIIQNPTFDAAKGVTSVTGANAGQIRDFALGFTSNLPIGKKWNIALNSTGRYARIKNNLQTGWADATAVNANANFSFKATSKFTITSSGGYFKPLRMPNMTFPDNYFYSLTFAQRVLKDKLTVTASAMNFFEERRIFSSYTETDYFITENRNNTPFRNFALSLNYNFGRLKENVSKKKGVNNDDKVE